MILPSLPDLRTPGPRYMGGQWSNMPCTRISRHSISNGFPTSLSISSSILIFRRSSLLVFSCSLGAAGDRAAIMKQGLKTIEHHFGSGRLAKDKPRVKSIREWPWEKALCHPKPSTSSSIPSRRLCLSVKSAGESYVQINREGGSKPK